MSAIDLKHSLVQRLEALAQSEGITLEAYLEQVAGQRAVNGERLSSLTGDELERLIEAEATSDSTYQGTYSRADIYSDHD